MGSFFSRSASKNVQQKTYRNLNSVINKTLKQRYNWNCLLPQYENLRGSIDAFDSPVTFVDSTTCNIQLQKLNQEEQQEMAKRAYPTNPNQSKPLQTPQMNSVSPTYNINKTSDPSSIISENKAAQIHPWLLGNTKYGGKRKRKTRKTKKYRKSRKN
jgi:hypothetical protein